jgi:GBP family porin
MKKKVIFTGVAIAFASAAQAQGTATLYGLIDTGLTFVSNQAGSARWAATSGTLSGNRWGVRGAEDLGGGLKAVFQLESGFDLNTGRLGQGGRGFGRQAFVGLSGSSWGALTMGRQYDSLVTYLAPLTANGGGAAGYFGHPFDNDNTNNSFRVNNSVKFSSPSYNGLQFGGLYGFSNRPGTGGPNNQAFSAGASYDNGGVTLAAAYVQLDRPGSAGGAVDDYNLLQSLTDEPTAPAYRQRTFGLGGSYAVGAAKVGAVWTQSVLDRLERAGSATSGSIKFNNYELNASYNIAPATTLTGMYTLTTGGMSGADKLRWHQFGLQADYLLSKRTDLYLAGAYQHVSSGGRAQLLGTGASDSRSQLAVTAGVRHRF